MSFFALKLVALVSMLWDHISATWSPVYWICNIFYPTATETPVLAQQLSHLLAYLGRIAAPIFLFCIANGFQHARDRIKYGMRLLVFALLSQFPYSLFNQVLMGTEYSFWDIGLNIIFTQLFGLIALCLWKNSRKRHWLLGFVETGAIILLAEMVPTEGGGRYVLYILIFYLTWNTAIWKRALLWLFLLPLSRYSWTWEIVTSLMAGTLDDRWLHLYLLNVLGPYLGVLLTFAYNGEKGPDHPFYKYLWYLFYPVHLLLLGLVGG